MTGPLFSIITPVYEPPVDVLRATIDSVTAQDWPDWEWVVVDDCSPSEQVRGVLAAAARQDSRIRVIERSKNGHIVAASNDALHAARGQFVILLDHDDLLTPDALRRVASVIDQHDDVDYLYSDEDKVDDAGNLFHRFHKPDWSPERLRGQMYCGHLSVIRRAVAESIGGFREGFDGSQDHDLILRVSEVARRVVHIPEVLYHWRVMPGSVAGDVDAKPYAREAGRKAVQEHVDRLGLDARITLAPEFPGYYRVSRTLPAERRVSIVIPTVGTSGQIWGEPWCFVLEAVRSALAKTDHENVEIVVVHDPPTPPKVLRQLRDIAGDKLVLVASDGPFDFSKKMNIGVAASSGDRLVLLNDDIMAVSDRWLEELVAPLDEPDVGMTGAKLMFDDMTIQHAGHRYTDGVYEHVFLGTPPGEPGAWGALLISRECSGVTAACAAMRRDVFDEVGGLSETLPVNYNDVDLSYKVRFAGRRIVWIANSELFHYQSRSRERTVDDWELARVRARWGTPVRDPYLPVI